ncbi:MAG: DUF1749 domain-containing protein [bacterium]|nr:DUF1749 domain-containing protein [bacterium]
MQQPEFIEIKTKDGLILPGLLYRAKRAQAAAIYLHGNGSSSVFYGESGNHPLAAALNKNGISVLFFNNRGAHIIKKLNVKQKRKTIRKPYGMAYEKIKECVPDIDGAISFLRKRGYKKFYLIGASTGANKICVYSFYKKDNEISKYVLLCGADDTGIYYHALGKSNFWKLLAKSKRKIKTGRGEEIIPELLPDIFSYLGFYDIANPNGDYNTFPFYEVIHKAKLSDKPLFRHFKSIKKPSLAVYGDQDEYAWGDVPRIVEILKRYQPKFDYKIIKGADHGFKGREKQLANIVANWLVKS